MVIMLKDKLYGSNDRFALREEDLINFNVYMDDVRNISCYDSNMNMKLMKIISSLIGEMEIIFDFLGCNEFYVGKNNVPWIADKVIWCCENCDNQETINKLNLIYNNYCKYRDQVVCGNLRLVVRFAKEYCDNLDSIEDMIQYGNMGLIRAVEKFDVNKGVTFNTYAGYWIKQCMMRGSKSIKYAMRIPMNKIYESLYVMDVRNELSLELGRTVTDKELSLLKNISLKKIVELLLCFEDPFSLDDILVSDYDDSDKECSRFELIEDKKCNYIDKFINLEYRKQLITWLSSILNEKELMVLKLYFGFDENEGSLLEPEIAKLMNVSQQRVHQVKKKALCKLHKKSNIRDIVIV